MSRKGDCWDNAPMESFFHTLKTELVMHCDYKTRDDAGVSLFDYMEQPAVTALIDWLRGPATVRGDEIAGHGVHRSWVRSNSAH